MDFHGIHGIGLCLFHRKQCRRLVDTRRLHCIDFALNQNIYLFPGYTNPQGLSLLENLWFCPQGVQRLSFKVHPSLLKFPSYCIPINCSWKRNIPILIAVILSVYCRYMYQQYNPEQLHNSIISFLYSHYMFPYIITN